MAPERGSTLALMPAAVLVLLVLAAIAVDNAVMFSRQRDLVAAAQSVAADAANVATVSGPLHSQLDAPLSLGPARRAAHASLQARGLDVQMQVALTADGRGVVVTLRRTVSPLFAPTGLRRLRSVQGRATARPHRVGQP